MTPQPAKALPAGFGLLRPEWMHSNALPKGSAVLLSEYPKEGWLLSSFAGEIVPATNVALDRYAAPLDSAPPEAFLADAQEAGAISNDSSIAEGREVTVGLPVVRKDEACTDVTISETPDSSTGSENQAPPAVTSQRDPNDDELKAAREELHLMTSERDNWISIAQTRLRTIEDLTARLNRVIGPVEQFCDILPTEKPATSSAGPEVQP
jgi:hypothetical protein